MPEQRFVNNKLDCLKNLSGVYQIRNVVNNKFYVGSSSNLHNRKNTHFRQLRKQKHPNSYLQNAFNKYGEDRFLFEVLQLCSDDNSLIPIEQKWMDRKRSYKRNNGYNISSVAGRNPWQKGKPVKEETKKKISFALKGRVFTEEWKRKISENRKNIKTSEETKEKLRKVPKKKGQENPLSKFTWEQVREIRRVYSNEKKVTYKQLAEKYGVSVSGIQNIIKNRTFFDESFSPKNNIKNIKGSKNPSAKLTKREVIEIRKKHIQGESIKDLAANYGVSIACIHKIISFKTWINIH